MNKNKERERQLFEKEVAPELKALIEAGLVIPVGDGYQLNLEAVLASDDPEVKKLVKKFMPGMTESH